MEWTTANRRGAAMKALVLLGALTWSWAPARADDRWKTSTPYTYNIDYSAGHVGNPEYLRKIRDAPPTLMNVGEDVPISSVFGTKEGYGGPQRTRAKLLTADEVRERIRTLREYTTAMRAAGVRWIIPYINNKAVLGDHVSRTGYWELFDHWDRFRDFRFGPRPPVDMVTAQMYAGFPARAAPRTMIPISPTSYTRCVSITRTGATMSWP